MAGQGYPIGASVGAIGGRSEVRWGPALAYGLAVAVVGSIVWGAIFAYGYISMLVSIVVGYGISWALVKGAGQVTTGLIVLAVALTLLMVFLGGVVAIMIVLSVGPLEAFSLYPELVSIAPGDVALGYVFGLVGAAYGGYALWRQRPERTSFGGTTPFPSPGITPATLGVSGETPTVQRGANDVTLEMTVHGSTPHRVRAYFTATTARAEVFLDGQQVAKTRVWGLKKEVDVSLPDSARRVQVRFRGAVVPDIDVLVDGAVVATTGAR